MKESDSTSVVESGHAGGEDGGLVDGAARAGPRQRAQLPARHAAGPRAVHAVGAAPVAGAPPGRILVLGAPRPSLLQTPRSDTVRSQPAQVLLCSRNF